MKHNAKNKSSMNKKHELFEILKDVKKGNKMAAEAYDEILLLFNVVGQSEQLPNSHCTLNRNTCGKGSVCKYPHCHL